MTHCAADPTLRLLKWHKVFSWAYFLFSPVVVVVVVAGRLPASTGGSLSQCGRQTLPWRSLSLSLSLARCDNTCRRKILNNLANDFSSGGPGMGGERGLVWPRFLALCKYQINYIPCSEINQVWRLHNPSKLTMQTTLTRTLFNPETSQKPVRLRHPPPRPPWHLLPAGAGGRLLTQFGAHFINHTQHLGGLEAATAVAATAVATWTGISRSECGTR